MSIKTSNSDTSLWASIALMLAQTGRRLGRGARRWSLRHVYPIAPGLHAWTFFRLRRAFIILSSAAEEKHYDLLPSLLLGTSGVSKHSYQPKVSIIVPCYNHGRYLQLRLESIEKQTYKNVEYILLDDASDDESMSLLKDFANRHTGITRLITNSKNSAKPFSQWQRGLSLANGELAWIAESDDFCTPNFLSELVPLFRNQAVMIAFCRVLFTDSSGEATTWDLPSYLSEISPEIWDHPFQATSHRLVNDVWARKNIIPNASGALLRNVGHYPWMDNEWQKQRVCGDWQFYLSLARGGMVAYTPHAINYYRQHEKNTSVSEHQSARYLSEHVATAERLVNLYKLNKSMAMKLRSSLHRRRESSCGDKATPELDERIDAVCSNSMRNSRKPNIMMAIYSMIPGGGEIMPIRLANSLKEAGYSVTMLNCNQYPTQGGVRTMLRPDIPLVEPDSLEALPKLMHDFGIDIIHSHHAWVDSTICELLGNSKRYSHVVTSHGFYDNLDSQEIRRLGSLLCTSVKQITYVADKNRDAFLRMGYDESRLHKIPNYVECNHSTFVDRRSLKIPVSAFTACLVSRGIREKGWEEAIQIILSARRKSGYDLHLLLVGNGAEQHRLSKIYTESFIHFLGFKPNAADYFALSDVGILPSFFAGESQPLTLLECLAVGRPFIASDIGEIRKMLTTPKGLAGNAIPLINSSVDIEGFTEAILKCLDSRERYQQQCQLAVEAAKRHEKGSIIRQYESIYAKALSM